MNLRRPNHSILKEISPEYSLEGLMLKLKHQYFVHVIQRANSLENTLMLGKIEGRRRKGTTEDEMVGWYHRLNGHEFEQDPGDGKGQESLGCCSPRSHKESDMTERLNSNRYYINTEFVVAVHSLSWVHLFAIPLITTHQASLSFSIPRVCPSTCPLNQ